MKVIGIDGGLSGAIAIIENGIVTIHDMPVYIVNKKRKYDLPRILEILSAYKNDSFAILEKAQPMPKQGVVSMFSTGFCYGAMLAFLLSLDIRKQIVPSQRWKSEYSLAGKDKKEAAIVAKNLYPSIQIHGPKGGILDGRGDAVLLADYGLRFYTRG